MNNEEKYKLALFAVIRNFRIMPAGMRLGKTMDEINEMALATMEEVLKRCNFEILKKQYNKAKEGSADNE